MVTANLPIGRFPRNALAGSKNQENTACKKHWLYDFGSVMSIFIHFVYFIQFYNISYTHFSFFPDIAPFISMIWL